jgi:hypothetical protein
MARQRNRLTTRTLTLSTTPQVLGYLRELLETGLYGKNEAEAAERLLTRALDTYLGAKRLTMKKDRRG